jgi:hypothetical protein
MMKYNSADAKKASAILKVYGHRSNYDQIILFLKSYAFVTFLALIIREGRSLGYHRQSRIRR